MHRPISKPARLTKRAAYWLLYFLYLLLSLAAFDYFLFYLPYKAHLLSKRPAVSKPIAPVGPISSDLIRALGGRLPAGARRSSFLDLSPQTTPGVKRLCAFGDSFVFGKEASLGFDYPSLLSIRLNKTSFGPVEVINFGESWIGFHQTYLLWAEFARAYRCEYVLIGPGTFYFERDTALNHSGGPDYRDPYYIHARFVLGPSDDVRLVEPEGGSNLEVFENFFAFVPSTAALRFDRNPPAFLAAPLFFLAPGRTIENPFYYRSSSAQTEALQTYDILLRRIAASGIPTLVLDYEGRIASIADKHISPSFEVLRLPKLQNFPYAAPNGHFSSVGNDMIASLVAGHLAGKGSDGFRKLQTETDPQLEQIDNSTCLDAAVLVNGRRVGSLVNIRAYGHQPFCGPEREVRNISVIRGDGEKLIDSFFFSTVRLPAYLAIEHIQKSASKTVYLSAERLGGIKVANAVFTVPFLSTVDPHGRVSYSYTNAFPQAAEGDTINIALDGTTIFSGTIRGDVALLNPKPELLGKFRCSDPWKLEDFPQEGCYELAIYNGKEVNKTNGGCFRKQELNDHPS